MCRLAIIDSDGKILTPQDLQTASDLLIVVEQARTMIRDCEQLAREAKKSNASPIGKNMPYLS